MTCWSQTLASNVRLGFSKTCPPFGFSGRPRQAPTAVWNSFKAPTCFHQAWQPAVRLGQHRKTESRFASCLSATISCLPECARFGKPCKPFIVIAKCLAQNIPGVLAEQWRRYGIDRGSEAHIEWRFDIGDRACGRVRNTAQPMALARFGRIEALLDRPKIANRYIGLLHLGDPVLKPVAREDSGNNGAQLFLVSRSSLSVCKLRIGDEIRPFEHFGNQATI